MSGPKYNAYILEQQRRLELQRIQEEERRKREEEKRRAIEAERKRLRAEKLREIEKIDDKINNESASLDKEFAAICRLEGFVDIDEWQQQYFMLSKKYSALKQKIASIQETNTLEQLISTLNVIENGRDNIQSEMTRLNQSAEELKEANKLLFENRLSKAIGRNLSFEMVQKDTKGTPQYDITVQQVYNKLFSLKDDRLSKELNETIDNKLQYLERIKDEGAKNFVALTLKPLEEEIKAFLGSLEEYEKTLLELRPRYMVLCEETGNIPEIFTATEVSINYLRSEIKRLEQLSMEFAERECIESAVNEVMLDMGYSVLGSCIKERKTGDVLRKSLYRYDDETAVNVTYSSGDCVVMEIGKMDLQDRIPDDVESNQLQLKMENFCSDFNEIECKLREKGVLLKKRIKMLPPTINYAQVINVSEYENGGVPVEFVHKKKSIISQKGRAVD